MGAASLKPSERADALREVLTSATGFSEVEIGQVPDRLHPTWESFAVGGTRLLRSVTPRYRMSNSRRGRRRESEQRFALTLWGGALEYNQYGVDHRVGSGQLALIDLDACTWVSRSRSGMTNTVLVTADSLDLPLEVVEAGSRRLAVSPLYSLVRTHLQQLCRDADRLSAPSATTVADITTQLVRALISTAGQDAARPTEVERDCSTTRIMLYIKHHLKDSRLTPAVIARHHSISTRTLYNLWSGQDTSLCQWIMAERLEAARADIADAVAGADTMAVIAHRWGFSDPTHFSRRFREAYDMSPRDWRHLSQVPVHVRRAAS